MGTTDNSFSALATPPNMIMDISGFYLLLVVVLTNSASVREPEPSTTSSSVTATLGPSSCVETEEHGCCWDNFVFDDALEEIGDYICEMACAYSGYWCNAYNHDEHSCCCTQPDSCFPNCLECPTA